MVTLNYPVCNHFEREPGFDTGSKKTSILLIVQKLLVITIYDKYDAFQQ